jgi:hypothetical protein
MEWSVRLLLRCYLSLGTPMRALDLDFGGTIFNIVPSKEGLGVRIFLNYIARRRLGQDTFIRRAEKP